jgi:hypothetical protein
VPVRVARSSRCHGDLGADRLDEWLGGRGPTAVVGDLEEVEARQVISEEVRIDLLLHVAGEEKMLAADPPQQHHGHVVDPGPGIWRFVRDLPADRPQHAHPDLIHGQVITGRDREVRRRVREAESLEPGGVPGTGSAHPGLEHPADPVASQQQRQTRDVVLVGMAEDHRIDASVPWRDPPIELHQQSIRVWPTVDQ